MNKSSNILFYMTLLCIVSCIPMDGEIKKKIKNNGIEQQNLESEVDGEDQSEDGKTFENLNVQNEQAAGSLPMNLPLETPIKIAPNINYRCQIIKVNSCPKQIGSRVEKLTSFNDTYKGLYKNEATCLKRADSYLKWCGFNKPQEKVTAIFYINGKKIKTRSVAPIVDYRCQINKVNSCPNQKGHRVEKLTSFDDTYKGYYKNETTCLNRASAYLNWCGFSKNKEKVTAKFYINENEINSKTVTPVIKIVSPVIKIVSEPLRAICKIKKINTCKRHSSSRIANMTNFNESKFSDKVSCFKRAKYYFDYCGFENKNDQVTATYIDSKEKVFNQSYYHFEKCYSSTGRAIIIRSDGMKTKAQNCSKGPNPLTQSNWMDGRVFTGYQGWFSAGPLDGSKLPRYLHWVKNQDRNNNLLPTTQNINVDMMPDLFGYPEKTLFPTDLTLRNNNQIKVYSSYLPEVADLHFKWMKQYKIAGAFQQRFLADIKDSRVKDFRDKTLLNSLAAAEKHNIAYVLMYDFSNFREDQDSVKIFKDDWTFLVEKMKILESPAYMWHKKRPLISLWGCGFTHVKLTLSKCQEIVNWLKTKAPVHLKATVMGGVPTYWTSLKNDSRSEPGWRQFYKSYDVISPWLVGRFRSKSEGQSFISKVGDDLRNIRSKNIDYIPTVWPGFSWKNINPDSASNAIARRGGDHLWEQISGYKSAGAKTIYLAMFDEVDEGTAIFKLISKSIALPVNSRTIALDADRLDLPTNWYLQLSKAASEIYSGARPNTQNIPKEYIVNRLYNTVLQREADQGGLEHYSKELKRGKSEGWLKNILKNSGEYKKKWPKGHTRIYHGP